jgi:hypothetical protein
MFETSSAGVIDIKSEVQPGALSSNVRGTLVLSKIAGLNIVTVSGKTVSIGGSEVSIALPGVYVGQWRGRHNIASGQAYVKFSCTKDSLSITGPGSWEVVGQMSTIGN